MLELRSLIDGSDALLIASPEYNYSVTSVLKNALDWASRPPRQSPLNGKPAAIMGAGGRFGTVRAQAHLRQIAVHSNLLLLSKPELMVASAREKSDADGQLIDDPTREQLASLLVALKEWTVLPRH